METWADLGEADRLSLDEIFSSQIFPVLMPLAVDPAHPFPYISGLSLNLSIRVRNPKSGKEEFARLKVPTNLPRFIQLPDDASGRLRYIPLEDLISNHLGDLFPGMEIQEYGYFRVTRDADFELVDESDDLLAAVEDELRRRASGGMARSAPISGACSMGTSRSTAFARSGVSWCERAGTWPAARWPG